MAESPDPLKELAKELVRESAKKVKSALGFGKHTVRNIFESIPSRRNNTSCM